MDQVAEAYETEREALYRDRERNKRQLIRDLLDGLPVDSARLAYDLGATHVGVVAWGRQPNGALTGLAERLGCPLLSVSDMGKAVWGWLGGVDVSRPSVRRTLNEAPPEGTFLAIGEAGLGTEGFRRTHAEALEAYQIGSVTGADVTRYADVALLALTTQDMSRAREFVRRELDFLAEMDERAAILRATLEAYFATGHNAAAAAAMLGVHVRTVGYRLRSIEDRLGYSVTLRSVELSVALRLIDLLRRSDPTG
jgi:hypothetical protein